MKAGHRSKSVSFGVVVTNKLDNSIISESSSVDIIDGAKVGTFGEKTFNRVNSEMVNSV